MASSTDVICTVCNAERADYWCPECEDALCYGCNTFHNTDKMSRSHNVIHIDRYTMYTKPRLTISEILQHYEEQDLPSSELGQTSAKEATEFDRMVYVDIHKEADMERDERFYVLNIQCDGLVVDCIVDSRIRSKYSHLFHDINTKTLFAKSNETEFRMQKKKVDADLPSIAASNTDFEILYTFSKIHPRHTDELELLKIAFKKRQDLVCRWLISHCSNSNVVLSIRPPKHDPEICRAISWTYTKMFYKQNSSSLTNCSVWPGVKCKCKRKEDDSQKCFKKGRLVIVVESETKICGLPPKFISFRIQHITPEIRSKALREASTILKAKLESNSYYLNISIPSDVAETIFKKHRNLTLLCPSPYKSQGYYRNHNVISSMRLQMFCRVKGIVPVGEDHFPNHVDGMETDVLEGCPRLATDIRIGEKIGTLVNIGTLGGFCTYMSRVCFLTCAHVLYDVTELLSSQHNFQPAVKSYVHTPNGPVECGSTIRRVFDHDNNQTTSVDAALVEINANFSVNPNDYIRDINGMPRTFQCLGMSSKVLEENCLDHKSLMNQSNITAVAAGAVSKHEKPIIGQFIEGEDIYFNNIGQAQARVNGVSFQPLLLISQAHMQVPAVPVQGDRIFRMYKQMVINIPLQAGDSGTCIYITGSPAGSGCLGMAIAHCNGFAIVTPLTEILSKL